MTMTVDEAAKIAFNAMEVTFPTEAKRDKLPYTVMITSKPSKADFDGSFRAVMMKDMPPQSALQVIEAFQVIWDYHELGER